MNLGKRWTTLLVLLLAATFFYAIGFIKGAVAVIVIGCLFEIAFWVKLFERNAQNGNG